jgi:catechol 2,3-dioxygenase-like lactoylglutathione lyase family enzyme
MSRIVHLALKVDDLERTTEFYRKVFGFVEVNTATIHRAT